MKQNLMIPGAIILSGAFIALAIFSRGDGGAMPTQIADGGHGGGVAVAQAAEREENPYIKGNPDAPVKIVEFSDFECPFCARLHPTLERVVEESNGQVAWEYRHFPLPSHRNAEDAAVAAECVGRIGGNDAFWDYTDLLFANQRGFNQNFYESAANNLGVNLDEFRSCMDSEEVQNIVRGDYNAAVATGGRGTPHSVVVYPDGTERPFSGALPYEQLIGLINQ